MTVLLHALSGPGVVAAAHAPSAPAVTAAPAAAHARHPEGLLVQRTLVLPTLVATAGKKR